MNRDPLLGWAMPFQVTGFHAASRGHYLKSAPFTGSTGRRLPSPVVQTAAASICLAALKIRRKQLPAAAAFSLKSP